MMKIVRLLKVAAAAFFFAWNPAVAQFAGTSPQPVTLGGTGLATIPSGSLMVGAGTAPVTPVSATSNGSCLLVVGLAWTQGNCLSSSTLIGTAPIVVSVASGVATISLNAASASTIGGVNSIALTANQWVQYIDTAGLPHLAQPAVSNLSGFGTGVATALGSALNGATGIVGYSGSLGTPTQGVLTNATGLPVSTGLSGTGTGVVAALGANVTGTGGIALANSPTLITPVLSGLPTGSVATAATPSTLASRDANGNAAFANTLEGYTSTATAAGTTLLTVASNWQQFFTGTSTQTVTLPVSSTLALGQSYLIQNLSTGTVAVNSSGGNQVALVAGGTSAVITATAITGTTAASWSAAYSAVSVAAGKVLTVSNNIALAGTDGTTFTFPSTSDTVVTLAAAQTLTNKSIAAAQLTGSLPATNFPALTGDLTTAAGSLATTFNTVNSNVGSFGSSTAIPNFTVNGKGLVTVAGANVVVAPAATLSGTTLATAVTASSLTSVGALTSGSLGSGFTAVAIAQGGTGQTTPAAARASSGLNVDQFTGHGDSAYTILSTDRTVGTTAAFTASRTWTLPAASAVNAGQQIKIVDLAGGVTATNTLTISRAGSDTINGGTTTAISAANGGYDLVSDGVSKWSAQGFAGATGGAVTAFNARSGSVTPLAGDYPPSLIGAVAGVKKQVFTASGTYTPSTGMLYAVVECVGGGGGGGGTASPGASISSTGGGGGGSDYSNVRLTAAAVGASQTVTIGAAGSFGASGNNAGGAGGDTSLGTLCVGKGGAGGAGNSAAGQVLGGAGGVAGTGDFSIPGQSGQAGVANGSSIIFPAGGGGASTLGFGGAAWAGSSALGGNTGKNYGGGGGGGFSYSAAGSVNGGAGAPGIVIITEYTNQ